MLLPALANSKSKAKRILCLNNLKQLHLVWSLYPSDNGETLPFNGSAATALPTPLWIGGETHTFVPAFTNTQYLLDKKFASFAEYLKSAAVYKCPEDKSLQIIGTAKIPKIRSYSLNGYLGTPSGITVQTPNYKIFKKTSNLATTAEPSRIFAFQDVNPENLCLPAFAVRMPGDSITGFYHYPSGLHKKSGVLIFADGHAESRRWVDPRTLKTVLPPVIIGHGNGSLNNPDLLWLQQRTTTKLP